MPPRTKLTKHTAPGTNTPAEEMEISGWERSKISNQDQSTLKRLGLLKKKDALIFPGDESFPTPRIGYRVTFIDHLIRGLSTPIHEFLRGLLFVYGIQLHQLTPNSILHISIFITMCECFLGTHPHWGLWKRIFYLRRNSSRNIAYNVGGVVICVRPDVDYFDVKFPDSVKGGAGGGCTFRRSTSARKSTTLLPLMNTHGQELSGVQITAYFLRIRVQPLQARKNPLWMYAGEEDVDRVSKDLSVKDLEKLIRRFSSLSKKHDVPTTCRVEPYSGNHALPENHQVLSSLPPLPEGGEVDERAIVTDDSQGPSRPESEVAGSHKSAASSERSESDASESARFPPSAVSPKDKRKRDEVEDSGTSTRKMGEDFTLHEAEEDRLLATLSVLELHGDLARTNISDARAAFTRLFPHFFPKQTQPQVFSELVRRFLPQEDLALAYRQENLKVGVEGTIALVADSRQDVDWAKAGDPKGMNTEKWKTLVKAAKPQSKKILAFLGHKPSSSASTAKPEVK
ncbi:hypothetical protein QYE76_036808 [Lolium multiflorum]|uniref:Transposase (putative) gypsy type domain-containing protein n=1 Tax=Lolium multiflorum TaxID=4521 RepID=A0AAD8R369_LOLMU|nr:hypothetical protein QYE76_036808 [Lolium multiflorum]